MNDQRNVVQLRTGFCLKRYGGVVSVGLEGRRTDEPNGVYRRGIRYRCGVCAMEGEVVEEVMNRTVIKTRFERTYGSLNCVERS